MAEKSSSEGYSSTSRQSLSSKLKNQNSENFPSLTDRFHHPVAASSPKHRKSSHKNIENETELQILENQVITPSDTFTDDSFRQIDCDTSVESNKQQIKEVRRKTQPQISKTKTTPKQVLETSLKKNESINTGLPSSTSAAKQQDSDSSLEDLRFRTATSSSVVELTFDSKRGNKMGNNQSERSESNGAKYIISEEPPQGTELRNRIPDAETTGNCRPWSNNVYHKLFLDPQGRDAKLMVLKCEISYVDIFTDEEHTLYKSRFIGAKDDGVAQLFVFDLMKSHWEKKIPQSHAIELNVDIVMSSAPIHQCSESLLNLLQLERSYLKHLKFDGQLNVMIRFAHSHAWDVKDDVIRERVHNGLRNLFREGVNLEVMSSDVIIEEMKVDNVLRSDDEKSKYYSTKRCNWKGAAQHSQKLRDSLKKKSFGQSSSTVADSSESEEDYEHVAEDDMYHVSLLDKLDQILANQYRIQGLPK